MKNLKTAAVVVLAALSANFATLAASDMTVQDTGIQAVVNVQMWADADVSAKISANRLYDYSELTWLNYGFSKLNDTLRIKQVIGNSSIKVSLDEAKLSGSENDLNLDFTVVSNGASFGVHPMIVVLENSKTGATAAVGINVVIE